MAPLAKVAFPVQSSARRLELGEMKTTTPSASLAGYVEPAHVYVTDRTPGAAMLITTKGSPARSASGSRAIPISGSAAVGGVREQLTPTANAMQKPPRASGVEYALKPAVKPSARPSNR
jgi:hypothetical protein